MKYANLVTRNYFAIIVMVICSNIAEAKDLKVKIDTAYAMPYYKNRFYAVVSIQNTTNNIIYINKLHLDKKVYFAITQRDLRGNSYMKINHLDIRYDSLMDTRLIQYDLTPNILYTDSAYLYSTFDSLALLHNKTIATHRLYQTATYVIPVGTSIKYTIPVEFVYEDVLSMKKLSQKQCEKIKLELALDMNYYVGESKVITHVVESTGESDMLTKVILRRWSQVEKQ